MTDIRTQRRRSRDRRRAAGTPAAGVLAIAYRTPDGQPDVVEDRAAAARRHPVPDAVLPDRPAADRRASTPGGRRADAAR